MAKQKKEKREIDEAADYVILALPAQGRSCVLESEVRDMYDGKKTKGKKIRKLLHTGNHVASSSKGNKKSNKHQRSAEDSSGHDIESGALSKLPDDNELLISFLRRVKARKKENYAWSPSDAEVLSSWIRRQKRKNQEQRDDLRSPSDDVLISLVRRPNRKKQEKVDKSVEINKETEKSEGTELSTCNPLEKDSFSQLPITSCFEKDSKRNDNASLVCLSGDRIEAEKKSEKHDLAESIQICRDVQATYPCLSATINFSDAEPYKKPFSKVDNMDISLVETRYNHAVITNSKNPEILFRNTFRSGGKFRPPVAQPTPNTMTLLQGPIRMENPSLVESVGPLQSICSEHLNEKEFDAENVKILASMELCASRDDDMNLLSHKGCVTGSLRKKLLVLDINGLLADIFSPAPSGYTADTIINGKSVFKRSFCNDFLEFCFCTIQCWCLVIKNKFLRGHFVMIFWNSALHDSMLVSGHQEQVKMWSQFWIF